MTLLALLFLPLTCLECPVRTAMFPPYLPRSGLSDTLAATLGRLHAEILDTGARSAAAANIPERQARPRSVTAGPSVGRPTSFVMHALGSSAAGSSAIHALGLSAASSGGGETLSGGLWRAGDGKEEEEEERLPAGGLHERLEALLAELRGGPPGDGELEDDHEDDDEDDDGEVSCRDGGGGGSSHLHGNGEVDGEYDDGPVDGLAGAGLDGRGSDAELEDMVTGLSGQGRTINSGKLGISNLDMSSFQRPADAEARLPEVSQGAWPPAPSRDNRKPSAAGNSSSHDGHRLCSALELGGVRDGLEGMFLQPGATLAGFVDRPDLWFPPEDDDEAVEQDGDDVSTLGGGGMSSGGLAPRQGGDGDTWDGVSMIPGLARLSSRLDELQCMQLKLALAASNVRKCLQHMTERLNEGEDEEGPSAGSKST
eukprot:jgi/Mesvir1/14865/Mv05478-RA.1